MQTITSAYNIEQYNNNNEQYQLTLDKKKIYIYWSLGIEKVELLINQWSDM